MEDLGTLPNPHGRVDVVDRAGDGPIYPHEIKERMAEYYGDGSMDRRLHVIPVVAGYGTINCYVFVLQGTPPKGHAVFYGAGGKGPIWFYDVSGWKYEQWDNVTLELEDK